MPWDFFSNELMAIFGYGKLSRSRSSNSQDKALMAPEPKKGVGANLFARSNPKKPNANYDEHLQLRRENQDQHSLIHRLGSDRKVNAKTVCANKKYRDRILALEQDIDELRKENTRGE